MGNVSSWLFIKDVNTAKKKPNNWPPSLKDRHNCGWSAISDSQQIPPFMSLYGYKCSEHIDNHYALTDFNLLINHIQTENFMHVFTNELKKFFFFSFKIKNKT